MKPITAVAAFGLAMGMTVINDLQADTFGSGLNTFTIEFVDVGEPGNAADGTGYGAVAEPFRIGELEVSRDMITKANTLGSLSITLANLSSFGGNGVNRPATGVAWNEAARFVNYLNDAAGFTKAYKFEFQPGAGNYDANANIQLWESGDVGYDANNRYRNSEAYYFLPSEDEWYKAAYYDAVNASYVDYPTGSDTVPSAVASGTADGTAVFDQNYNQGPADVGQTGGLSLYGTRGQGGNAFEWQESAADGTNDSPSGDRGLRSGRWFNNADSLQSSTRFAIAPSSENLTVGFRVASVPEPSTTALLIVGALGMLILLRRRPNHAR